MDFIFEPGLVLYLPLHQLDGASLMSRDKHGHTCTITGATWTPRGRSFDGQDDKISIADNNVFTFGDGSNDRPFTLEAWVSMDDATNFEIISKDASNNREWAFLTSTDDKLYFWLLDNSVSAATFIGRMYNTAITSHQNSWIHLIATYGGSQVSSGAKIYLNGNRVDNTNSEYGGTYVAMENKAAAVWMGARTTKFAKGLFGEVRIYNRALNPQEIQHNYLATKWRYR